MTQIWIIILVSNCIFFFSIRIHINECILLRWKIFWIIFCFLMSNIDYIIIMQMNKCWNLKLNKIAQWTNSSDYFLNLLTQSKIRFETKSRSKFWQEQITKLTYINQKLKNCLQKSGIFQKHRLSNCSNNPELADLNYLK